MRVVAALAALLLGACHGRSSRKFDPSVERGPAVVSHYGALAFAAYQDATHGAKALRSAVGTLVAQPSAGNLEAARAAWLAARRPYLQTEALRFYGGPIDKLEMLVNTWPIDERYIEAPAGIIGDSAKYPRLTALLLASLNVKEGETSVTTGYHAIEFLLWGADEDPHGPGRRPYTDYVVSGPRAGEARRRGQYLELVADLLVRHLETVTAAWAPGTGEYRARLERMPVREALGLIIRGMGALGGSELAGERLTVAYATKNQENEHSCFSDNTHADIVLDATGIENVCLGRYQRVDGTLLAGPGVCALLADLDADLGARLTSEIAASVQAARAIPAPFDQAILGPDTAPGRQAIQRTITALETQTATLTQAAAALGLGLTATAAP
jgi:putative iron-regulated protein